MTTERASGQGAAMRQGPTCPFCGAGWSVAMLDRYEALADPRGCACCGSAGALDQADVHAHEPRPVPTGDLCCDTCGRAIMRAPSSL
ncbi:MAG: hypothetical protein J0I80_12990 [Sphingomonas sp.]|nr:hypothetical protein [Sphingomonas sp.]